MGERMTISVRLIDAYNRGYITRAEYLAYLDVGLKNSSYVEVSGYAEIVEDTNVYTQYVNSVSTETTNIILADPGDGYQYKIHGWSLSADTNVYITLKQGETPLYYHVLLSNWSEDFGLFPITLAENAALILTKEGNVNVTGGVRYQTATVTT
jgi:hypothetical protein